MPIPTERRIETEIPEYPITAPFSGIQSEMSASDIEKIGGFQDCQNIILRKGRATVRPGRVSLPPLTSPVLGIADFYDLNGNRHQVVITKTGLYEWNVNTSSWNQITGALTGGPVSLFDWDVVGYKLCFCQGVDNIQMWDGIATSFSPVSSSAYPAYRLMELNTHLVAGYTIESGQAFPQRIRWSGANDPTDWTSFDSGIQDLLGDLGPIGAMERIGQEGVILQADGVTQMVPTGIGLNPFYFFPLGSKQHGIGFPYSAVSLPDLGTFYIAKDNIYLIDTGFNFQPIGSSTVQGSNYHRGARTVILAELQKVSSNVVTSFISVAINGLDYLAYWIVIPGQSVWIYNIVEGNWTRWTWGTQSMLNLAGRFVNPQIPTIGQLQGNIAQQSWSPNTLTSLNPFDMVLLGFSDGSVSQLDFTSYSEQPWAIQGPQHAFGDLRHSKASSGFRIVYQDIGQSTVNFQMSTENGGFYSETDVFGNGTGLIMEQMIRFKISGVFHSWRVGGAARVPASFTEFAPLYVTGGEYKNNP